MLTPQQTKRSNDNAIHDHNDFKAGHDALAQKSKEALLETLISKSRSLLAIAEEEAVMLANNNISAFADLQMRKKDLAEDYAGACEIFHARAEEFRGFAPSLLDRLDQLQVQIGLTSRANNKALQTLMSAARDNTASTLLAAQEIGQITDRH